MDIHMFAEIVGHMRAAQKDYERTGDERVKEHMRELERRVDQEVCTVKARGQGWLL